MKDEKYIQIFPLYPLLFGMSLYLYPSGSDAEYYIRLPLPSQLYLLNSSAQYKMAAFNIPLIYGL
jgi:hypothetical protein